MIMAVGAGGLLCAMGAGATAAGAATSSASAPGAPTGLQATAGDQTVTLSWAAPSDNGGSSIEGYNIYEASTSGNESPVPLNGLVLVKGTSDTIQLSNGTYFFEVSAVSADGGESIPSSEISAAPAAETPAQPTGVTAASSVIDDSPSAVVTWSPSVEPNGSPAAYYSINETDVTTGTTTNAVDTYVDGTSDTIEGLNAGDSYTFSVVAYDSAGDASNASSPSSAVVVPPASAPSTIDDLAARFGNGEVTLEFSEPADNLSSISGYNVYEGTAAGKEGSSPVNGAYPVQPSYCGDGYCYLQVPGLSNGTDYFFTVSAVNAVGTAQQSNETDATPAETAPGAPGNLKATPGVGSIDLSWTAPSSAGGWPIDAYKVVEFDGSGDYMGYQYVTGTSATIDSLSYGNYTFEVKAVNFDHALDHHEGESAPATITASPSSQAGGISLTAAQDDQTPGDVVFNWNVPSYLGNGSAPSTYALFEGTPGSGVQLASIAASGACTGSSCTWETATPLTDGQAYSFYIVGYNGTNSAPSNVVSFNGWQSQPSAPSLLSAASDESGIGVDLAWTAPTYLGTLTSTGTDGSTQHNQPSFLDYVVSLNGSPVGDNYGTGCETTNLNSLGSTTCDVTGLLTGTSYSFSVAAANLSGTSDASNALSATPAVAASDLPTSPQNLAIGATSPTSVSLSWSAPASNGGSPVLGYDVLGADGHVLNTSLITGTSFKVTGLIAGDSYCFKVVALNANGWGDSSYISTDTLFFNPPSGLTAVSNGSLIQLNWNPATGEAAGMVAGYDICTGGTFTYDGDTESIPADACDLVLNGLGLGLDGPLQSATKANYITPGQPVSGTSATLDLAKAQQLLSEVGITFSNVSFSVMPVTQYGCPLFGEQSNVAVPTTGQIGADLPAAPTSVSAARAGGGSAFVAWHAPADGGSAITSYVVTPFRNGVAQPSKTVTGPTSTTIHGLTPGANYFFTVAAENAVGSGTSSQSNVVNVTKYNPAVTLKASASKITFGKESGETISVKASGPAGSPAPTGTVTVDGQTLHLSGGAASFNLSAKQLSVGTHSLKASYNGDSNFNATHSNTVKVLVEKAAK